MPENPYVFSEYNIFISLLITLLAITTGAFIARRLLSRKLQQVMYADSEFQADTPVPVTTDEKVQPGHGLTFFEINSTTISNEAVRLRESLIQRAKNIFWKSTVVDLLAAAGFLLFTYVAGNIYHSDWYEKRFISQEIPNDDNVWAGFIIGVIIFIVSSFRYIIFQSQFRATGRGLIWLYSRYIRFFNGFFLSPKYSLSWASFYILLAILGVISNLINYAWVIRLALLMASALYIFMIIRLFRFYRISHNYKLLILRVFGLDNTAKFTFDGLWKYWQHFGSFFTVVDKSFLQSQIKIWRRLIVLLILIFLLKMLMHDGNGGTFIILIIIMLFLLGYIVSVINNFRKYNKSIIGNKVMLDNRLAFIKKWPRKLSQTFREMPVICYGNTWKMAVTQFVQIADTILMDLRGFNDERKGCEQEVKLLLDTVPLNRITFLVEGKDILAVKNLIQECWKSVRSTSPNLSLDEPGVTIYQSSKKNNKDIQGIVDTLLSAAIFSNPTNATQNA